MRGLAVGTLNRWIGEDQRHDFLNAVFPGCKGSIKSLTPQQLSNLLDWFGLVKDPISAKYGESDQSTIALRDMLAALREYAHSQGQQVFA